MLLRSTKQQCQKSGIENENQQQHSASTLLETGLYAEFKREPRFAKPLHPGKQHDIRIESQYRQQPRISISLQRAYSEESFDDFVRPKILPQAARVRLNALVHVPERERENKQRSQSKTIERRLTSPGIALCPAAPGPHSDCRKEFRPSNDCDCTDCN